MGIGDTRFDLAANTTDDAHRGSLSLAEHRGSRGDKAEEERRMKKMKKS
jgi:hypothetical protein